MTQALEGIENMVLLILLSVVVATLGILYIGFQYFIKPLTQRVRRGVLPEYQEVVQFTRTQLARAPQGDGAEERREPLPAGSDACPVCMDAVTYAIETNCGHIFCALCITTYWHTGRWTGPIACPMCRSTVNLLLPRFSSNEQREARSPVGENQPQPQARLLLAEIAVYNRRHSGAPVPWLEQLRDLPVLLPYVVSRLFSLDGLNLMYRARIFIVLLFGIVYMIMPLDIIPEAFFGFLGVLDDVAIFVMVAVYAVMVYRQYAAQQEPLPLTRYQPEGSWMLRLNPRGGQPVKPGSLNSRFPPSMQPDLHRGQPPRIRPWKVAKRKEIQQLRSSDGPFMHSGRYRRWCRIFV